MYSELTSRILVGGYVSRSIDVQVLAHDGVTDVINSSSEELPEIISNQFHVLEMRDVNWHGCEPEYWFRLFTFIKRALQRTGSKLYLHVVPENGESPDSPVVVYAVLRMLGYSALQARVKLSEMHPVVRWHDMAMTAIDLEFKAWAKEHHFREDCKRIRTDRQPVVVPVPVVRVPAEKTVSLGEVLDGLAEWS